MITDNTQETPNIWVSRNPDYTLCECEIESLKQFVTGLEQGLQIEILKQPSICLTMIPAEDSLEAQPFYLGEALMTECEVAINGQTGFGVCLGEQPVRAYCISVIDALLHDGTPHVAIEQFLQKQGEKVAKRDQDEFDLILQTQVDFKLMEEA